MGKWWLIGAATVLGVLLIASIALALTSQETEFAPGTPEHAVQSLLRAAENNDIEAVHVMLSEELLEKCELKDYANRGGYNLSDENDIRATLRDTKLIDGVTFVTVRVTEFHGSGPFDSGQYSFDHVFELQQEGGEWKFTEFPWPYGFCPESDSE